MMKGRPTNDFAGRPYFLSLTGTGTVASLFLSTVRSLVHTVFKSQYHPRGRPKGFVYTEALARPIGACTTPLMIGATAAALQGHLVWGYLVWGFPSALIVATLWTHFRLSSTTAELHLRPGRIAIRSIQDVLLKRPIEWHPLHNVRVSPEYTEVSVGWATQVCRRTDWPEYKQLRKAAQQAFDPRKEPSRSAHP